MALPASGVDTAVGLGKETTYGTAVSATVTFKPLTFDVSADDALVPTETGFVGKYVQFGYDASNPRSFLPVKKVEGSASFELEFDDVGHFLDNAVNTASTTTDSPVTGANTHVFSIPTSALSSMPSSLTLVYNNGVQDYRYHGCHIESLEISGDSDGHIISYTLGIVAQDWSTGSFVPGSLSAAPYAEFRNSAVRYDVIGTVPDSADDLTGGEAVASWTYRLTKPLRRIGQAGSNLIREPIPNGFWTSEFEFTHDFFSTNQQAIMRHATPSSRFKFLTMYVSSDTFITGSTPYSLEIRMPAALFQGDMPTYGGGMDITEETVRVVAAYDGTNSPTTIRLINGTSSY